ncbi:MAG: hypothetical protein SNI51_04880 [Rikenellaceae bacterium]
MRKLFSALMLFTLVIAISTSCSDNDDSFYVSVSGEGSIVVDNDSPNYLYRMVLFSFTDYQELYFMGSTAYVNGDADFVGRGIMVKIIMPNSDNNTTLLAQSFDIGTENYTVSYSPYVSFSTSSESQDYITIDSGTVIIRRSGDYYDVRMLGIDAEEQNIIMSYRGYIYRSFSYDQEDDMRTI